MFAVLHALGMFIADLFKSRWQLEAENLASSSTVRRPGTAHMDDADLAGSARRGPGGSAGDYPFGGIAPGSKLSGAGNPEIGQGGQRSIVSCAISFNG